MAKIDIITVTPENVGRYGIGCIRDKKHPGYQAKVEWFKEQYKKGLTLKVAHRDGKYAGFIEYTPGENAWRPVRAEGYLFIHCIWVYPSKNLNLGLGSMLVKSCIDEAKAKDFSGVAVAVSEGSWMAGESLFKKMGFETVANSDRFALLSYPLKEAPSPAFIDWDSSAEGHKGLELLYSHQCPANAKSIHDIREIASEAGIDLNITEIERQQDALKAPTGFGVFQLLYDGEVLADHYISGTRFKNILKKRKML
jgi:L-amino acid N-acyltransferase YncA